MIHCARHPNKRKQHLITKSLKQYYLSTKKRTTIKVVRFVVPLRPKRAYPEHPPFLEKK